MSKQKSAPIITQQESLNDILSTFVFSFEIKFIIVFSIIIGFLANDIDFYIMLNLCLSTIKLAKKRIFGMEDY